MAGETFQLRFRNSEDITVSIDEPINFATVDFQLSQKDKGYGRDVSFNGGETQFEFVNYRNHYLGKLLTYNKTYGFESIVELIITSGTISTIIGELDFATAITDDLEYFKCKVIQQSSKQVIKRRKSIKVDLLGNKDVDGNYLAPLVPENILLISKPIYKKSTWSQNSDYSIALGKTLTYINPAQYLNTHEIKNSYSPYVINTVNAEVEHKIITFVSEGLGVNISIKNLVIIITNPNGYTGSSNIKITARYGTAYVGSTLVTLYNNTVSFSSTTTINTNSTIPNIPMGNSLWLSIEVQNNGEPGLNVSIKFKTMNVEISEENQTYNSVVPAFRLINVMKQVIKSISGSDVSSIRFGTPLTGAFYNDFIFNGNSLRLLPDKPFSISLEDIEKSIVEMNADWEIAPDGKVFFGIEDDYYTDINCGTFTYTQFSQMNKTFNPKFSINEFNYGYKNFQSLKENEEPNSADVIHGESKWVLNNKMVENKKDISIEWTRDSFLIETNRRKSLEITKGTASQDDTDLFAIDAVGNTSNKSFSASTTFSHSLSGTTLLLTGDGYINFKVLGIVVGNSFVITGGYNLGTYNVISVSDSTLGLTLVSGATPSGNLVPQITTYTYTLLASTIPNVIYLDNGFTGITNLISSDKFANLRYSVRRNIENYWKKYLATCNIYHKTQGINKSWYKNNELFGATYGGLTLVENQQIDTSSTTPLLTPFIYNDVIFSNVEFSDFIALQNKIRTDRGYILTKDNNGNDLKLYPMNMKYDNLSRELTIKGEEKYI